MKKITVFLSDWQVLFREGIHFTLSGEEDFIVTGETTTNQDALAFITENPPDIAVVNVNHSDFSGIEFTRRVKQNYPFISVILVMDTDNEEQLYSALKCGAAACIAKDIDPEELVMLIRQITEGVEPIRSSILRPGIAEKILDDFEGYTVLDKEVDNLLAKLTLRERDVLNHIMRGDTIDDMISTFGITRDTAESSLDSIRIKLERNEISSNIVDASQKGLSAVIQRTRRGKKTDSYISREEFEAFKDSLIEHFRTFSE
ncbi:MAG: response regulator [Dehalococcoidales bacterium]|nr:response regulator [Dehalococcoidales bacterium]